MRRFKFRFEAVEKIRHNREQQVLRLFGSAMRDLERAKSYKQNLVNKLERAKEERESLSSRPARPADFALVDQYVVGTKARIIQSNNAIARAEKALEKARRVYLFARQQLKAIELLRERHHLEWKREVAKIEQKRVEDVVNSRAASKAAAQLEEDQEGAA